MGHARVTVKPATRCRGCGEHAIAIVLRPRGTFWALCGACVPMEAWLRELDANLEEMLP